MRSTNLGPNRSMEARMRGTSARSTPVPTIISVPSFQFRSRSGNGEAAVLDSLGADQDIRHFPDFHRLTPHHQHFQAMVVVQVDMQGGEDGVMVVVLDIGQLLVEQAHVMVIDQGDGSDY